jgi:hypothetical protein
LKELSNKNSAIGAALALVSVIAFLVLFTLTYPTLQGINPTAAFAAITVAVIGIVWFKKTGC